MNVRFQKTARGEIADNGSISAAGLNDRLAKGDNPLRVLREWRDVTQLYLSFKTKLSQGYISDVETGRRKGAAAALRRIADALKVPLDLLVSA